MSVKMCVVCGERPAEVPDRNEGMGRRINKICRQCHGKRLAGDMSAILAEHEKRKRRATGSGEE